MQIKKILKKTAIVLGIVLIIIQFFRPEKNNTGAKGNQIALAYPIHTEVNTLLKTACYDCHSNTTEYPWYSNFQPIAWWLNDHITEGKKHLNFDEFLSYPLHRQFHKLEEIDEVLTEGEMPLESYTLVHKNAVLDENSKELIIHWSKALMDSMKNRYPADSLIQPKKRKK